MNKTPLFLSFIIPVYNVEPYLSDCIESILILPFSDFEVILIDDGSTDNSGKIADEYERKDQRISVYHQQNQGLSTTRNRGIELAKGEYIAFVDSDDWLIKDSFFEIYNTAKDYRPDMVMGNLLYVYPTGKTANPFAPVPDDLIGIELTGIQCFIGLMKQNVFPPMVCNYLYRLEWVRKERLQFENVLHEDELWTPVSLCKARKVIVTNIDFYGYRQREGSIMNTLPKEKRIIDLIFIANRLVRFASGYAFNPDYRELKSLLFVKIFWLYQIAFSLLAGVRNSHFKLPSHHLYSFIHLRKKLVGEARRACAGYYRVAKRGLRRYRRWAISCWLPGKPATADSLQEKKLVLVYNTMWNAPLDIPIAEIPDNCLISTDRAYMENADLVVFHLPDLEQTLEGDLDKPEGQKWVAWSLECEENYPFMKDPEFMEVFDYRMSYHQDADIVYSYYQSDFKKQLLNMPEYGFSRKKNVCMLISSPYNRSKRQEFLQELMQYIEIDSYGSLFNNIQLEEDSGRDSKMELYKVYKFVIAFENSCAPDYVTEKFYDPLLAGAVPIYLGAPNILDFAPGENCFVNAGDFNTPQSLALFLQKACADETIYNQFFQWKKEPLNLSFTRKAKEQHIHPFVRLCRL